ncbi:eCIS core domain-containing protein [Saccharothrix coeruleofusca]|uniref:eCIS core domain-containing protein n=1 Tax=Saccharothrix coeruleofusca TaxID=33919 RepID=A0A918EEG3_9PSEU|nr:DUF4157 domain-containing protein [Saccharothrix coeruleofusca]GGP65446.1 hypothetical protein GCM10010185_42810 [Saccharothrix coeruleofusca]
MHAHETERGRPERPAAGLTANAHSGPEARQDQGSSQPSDLLALQRLVGNAAVARMMTGHTEHPVQRSAVHDVVGSGGRPLDAPVRAEMEARLGADFSDVRVHTDAAARRSASELGAHAYTSGNHVVIGQGGGDRHTLAHELTHVIQQRSGPVPATPQSSGIAVSDPGDPFERAAEANARRVMAGAPPEVRQAEESHAGHGHPTVQRLAMTEFDGLLTQHDLADDPDFIAFFELQRGRANPDAVVNSFDPAATPRLRQLVEDPAVTREMVESYIQDYANLPAGQRQQPATLDNANLTGLEMEMGNTVLRVESWMANGVEIARSVRDTAVGLPVFKLEIEGMDRDPDRPSLELIYGPLPTADYRSPALIAARNKLRTALSRSGTVKEMIDRYNQSLAGLAERRYRLNDNPPHSTARKGVTSPANFVTQTNVSTPYAKVGREPAANQTPQQQQRDFVNFFENPANNNDARMYRQARTRAAALVNDINDNWRTAHQAAGQLRAGPNLNSMLTHVLFQEAKYLVHEVSRTAVDPAKKHHFHVMLKLSPQDAAMTIISDNDAKLLLAWLVATRATPLGTAVETTFAASRSQQQPTVDAQPIYDYLVDVLVARLVAGRQLLDDSPDATMASPVYGANRKLGDVRHVHPRPSNRVKATMITVNATTGTRRYYFVVEQRSMAHPINSNAATNPTTAVSQITDLQAI